MNVRLRHFKMRHFLLKYLIYMLIVSTINRVIPYFSFQLLLTNAELMDDKFGWLNDLNLEGGDSNNDTGEMYEDLTSLLVGSHYMTFKTTAYHALKDILKTKDNATKNANLTDLQQFPKENVTIHDISNTSLGRIIIIIMEVLFLFSQ